jgi:hypothetical protein
VDCLKPTQKGKTMSNYSAKISVLDHLLRSAKALAYPAVPSKVNEFFKEQEVDNYYTSQGWTKVSYSKQATTVKAYLGVVTAICPARLTDTGFDTAIHRMAFTEGRFYDYGDKPNQSKPLHPFLNGEAKVGGQTVTVPSIAVDGGCFIFFEQGTAEMGDHALVSCMKGSDTRAFNMSLTVLDHAISSYVNNEGGALAEVVELREKVYTAIKETCEKAGINTSTQLEIAVVGFASKITKKHKTAKKDENGKEIKAEGTFKTPALTFHVPVFNLYVRPCHVEKSAADWIRDLKVITDSMGIADSSWLFNTKDAVDTKTVNTKANKANGSFDNTKAVADKASKVLMNKGKDMAIEDDYYIDEDDTVAPATSFEALVGLALLPTPQHRLALAFSVALKDGAKVGIAEGVYVAFTNAINNKVGQAVTIRNLLLNNASKLDKGNITKAYKALAKLSAKQVEDALTYACTNKVLLSVGIKSLTKVTKPVEPKTEEVSASGTKETVTNTVSTDTTKMGETTSEVGNKVANEVDNIFFAPVARDYTKADNGVGVDHFKAEQQGFNAESNSTNVEPEADLDSDFDDDIDVEVEPKLNSADLDADFDSSSDTDVEVTVGSVKSSFGFKR